MNRFRLQITFEHLPRLNWMLLLAVCDKIKFFKSALLSMTSCFISAPAIKVHSHMSHLFPNEIAFRCIGVFAQNLTLTAWQWCSRKGEYGG